MCTSVGARHRPIHMLDWAPQAQGRRLRSRHRQRRVSPARGMVEKRASLRRARLPWTSPIVCMHTPSLMHTNTQARSRTFAINRVAILCGRGQRNAGDIALLNSSVVGARLLCNCGLCICVGLLPPCGRRSPLHGPSRRGGVARCCDAVALASGIVRVCFRGALMVAPAAFVPSAFAAMCWSRAFLRCGGAPCLRQASGLVLDAFALCVDGFAFRCS